MKKLWNLLTKPNSEKLTDFSNRMQSVKTDALELEKLYRENSRYFGLALSELYASHSGEPLFQFWNARLHYSPVKGSVVTETASHPLADILIILILTLIGGTIAILPGIFQLDSNLFYRNNLALIAVFFPMVLFNIKNPSSWVNALLCSLVIALLAVYFNAYIGQLSPLDRAPVLNAQNMQAVTFANDAVIISYISQLVILWFALAIAFMGKILYDRDSMVQYIRFNGEAILMGTIVGICIGIFSLITYGLFIVIGIDISSDYIKWILPYFLIAAPILTCYLSMTQLQFAKNLAPVIAKIFAPIVMVTLIVYLVVMAVSGKSVFIDREYLLTFNIMLIAVLGIVIFTVCGRNASDKTEFSDTINLALLTIAIIVNGIALSAILFRVASFGISPNKLTVTGTNILVFAHLIGVVVCYILYFTKKRDISLLQKFIVRFLPVYLVWGVFLTFFMPLMFAVK